MLCAFQQMLQLAERMAHLRARFIGQMRLPRLLDLRFEQRERPARPFPAAAASKAARTTASY